MEALNLPNYTEQLNINSSTNTIFDLVRKKHLVLTPEEWVRQNFILYLKNDKNFPLGLIGVEQGLTLNGLKRRCDIVGYDNTGKARLIVECKAPKVKITQKTFDQIASYNLKLNVDFLVVTNGLNHFCCLMDYTNNSYQFLEDIPGYEQISSY